MNLESMMTVLSTASFALIWYVQLVSYPLFHYVGEHQWPAYHMQHTRRITWIMGPLMLLQLAVATLLAFSQIWWDLILVSLVFILTFFWAVPLHNRLASQWDKKNIENLIRSNLFRALIWTLLWGINIERIL